MMKRISRILGYVFLLFALLAALSAGVVAVDSPGILSVLILELVMTTMGFGTVGFLLWAVSNLYDEIAALEGEVEQLKQE
jgi:hypothetical protein